MDAALEDAETGMARLPPEGGERALGPAQRQAHGAGAFGFGMGKGQALVELHLDGRAEEMLNFHGALRRQLMTAAIDVRSKGDAALVDVPELGERHHLEAARVGQDRTWPADEAVEAAEPGDAFGTRTQHQVVGVAEDDVGAELLQLIEIDGLHRSGGADRHEGRGADPAARRVDDAEAGIAVLADNPKAEVGGVRHGERNNRLASP